jgi:hypothetical protein
MDLFTEFMVAAKELLRVTELVTLTGKPDIMEQELSNYTHLLEKREPMLKKLSNLIQRLEEHDLTEEQRLEAKELLAQVAEVDQKLMSDAKMFVVSIQGQIQGMESNKKLGTGYSHPMEQFSRTGSGIDTSQ